MKIEESKILYTMYLTDAEFELLHRICNPINYGYTYTGNYRDDDGLWKLILEEDMLDDIKYFLERERDYQLYDECNRVYAEEIQELINDIYFELNYNL